jgi:ApbE superfamily uncharacterized protein (UPF0280 family)
METADRLLAELRDDQQIESYRAQARPRQLHTFRARLKESNVLVACDRPLRHQLVAELREQRGDLEAYIAQRPHFARSLRPVAVADDAPSIVRRMAAAAEAMQVGPMAAVAGALADAIGRRLLLSGDEVMVENGGDLFCRVRRPRVAMIDPGASSLAGRLGIRIRPEDGPLGLCTSSGTVGHSLSFGQADAVTVMAGSGALADAAATAIGNRVGGPGSVAAALRFAEHLPGLRGVVVICGERLGAAGEIELVELDAKPPRARERVEEVLR